ncbi:uncharacterized protein LOC126436318 [Schistocerca serialis cubense]|uniref:uncharacterized protein LOC126436318 n=1 Tax=Schistocerca serialis cubense TaxID=2023355 RepID=UPI00214EF8B7|nr:uncharacterized protein LOC126436318 [Schistocerca serialis cubense]
MVVEREGEQWAKVAYADDLAIIIKGQSRKQIEERAKTALGEVSRWTRQNKLAISHHKTVAMTIRGTFDRHRPPTIPFEGKNIKFVQEFTYLGITLDERLWFTPHVRNIQKKLGEVSGMVQQRGQIGRSTGSLYNPEEVRDITGGSMVDVGIQTDVDLETAVGRLTSRLSSTKLKEPVKQDLRISNQEDVSKVPTEDTSGGGGSSCLDEDTVNNVKLNTVNNVKLNGEGTSYNAVGPGGVYDDFERKLRLNRLEEPVLLTTALRQLVRTGHSNGKDITYPALEDVDCISLHAANLPSQPDDLKELVQQVFARRGRKFDLEKIYKDMVKMYGRNVVDLSKPWPASRLQVFYPPG